MIAAAVILLLITAFFHFLPRLTRPALFFGVTVDAAFRSSPVAARIIRFYRIILWSAVLLTIALAQLTGHQEVILLQVAAYYFAIAVAHRRALHYAVEADSTVEVDVAAPCESFPGITLAILALFGSYAALAVWIWRNWDHLPARIPARWTVHGVERWATRTPASVYGILAGDALFSLLFVLMAVGILHWSRRASLRSSVGAEEHRFRRVSAGILMLLACAPAVQPWIILHPPPASNAWPFAAGLAAFAVYFTVLIRNRPRLSSRSGDYTPNRCWKLGIFYFNPADPALFVLQRFGIGYTFNFANRWAWAGLATVLLAATLRASLR